MIGEWQMKNGPADKHRGRFILNEYAKQLNHDYRIIWL